MLISEYIAQDQHLLDTQYIYCLSSDFSNDFSIDFLYSYSKADSFSVFQQISNNYQYCGTISFQGQQQANTIQLPIAQLPIDHEFSIDLKYAIGFTKYSIYLSNGFGTSSAALLSDSSGNAISGNILSMPSIFKCILPTSGWIDCTLVLQSPKLVLTKHLLIQSGSKQIFCI